MTEPDFCSHTGALRLARTLEQFWEARGHYVSVWPVDVARDHNLTSIYGVRSDMVGGLPKGAELTPALLRSLVWRGTKKHD